MESESLTLLDTSVLVEFLRGSKSGEVGTVRELIESGEGAWCDIVKLELWAGARGTKEKNAIEGLSEALYLIETTNDVWNRAFLLAQQCRAAGLTIPSPDLLICAAAIERGCNTLSLDAHIHAVLKRFTSKQ